MHSNHHQTQEIAIDGHSLTIGQVVNVARHGAKVVIAPSALEAVRLSRALVERIIGENRVAYGISTGFGEFSKVSIGAENSGRLQENLILSHCVAVGKPLSEPTVRAMILLRANALLKGHSGIRPEIVEALTEMLNKGIHPIVPEKGSLGASGDLAPLAHMCFRLSERARQYIMEGVCQARRPWRKLE